MLLPYLYLQCADQPEIQRVEMLLTRDAARKSLSMLEEEMSGQMEVLLVVCFRRIGEPLFD
jgi:hypothetical protein